MPLFYSKLLVLGVSILFSTYALAHVLESSETSYTHAESDPDAEYHTHEILGFTVHILVEDVEDQPENAEAMLWFIRGQLQQLVNILPPDKLQLLRTVETWINDDYDDDDEICGYACYIPERYRGADFYEDRRGAIILRDFELNLDRAWCCSFQLMLHEMAHALHDQFITDGFRNDFIDDVYDDVVDSGALENNRVMYPWWENQRVEHDGLTDVAEFFATMTETFFLWFWVYPHNLRDMYEDADFYDAYDMIVTTWWLTDVEDNEVDPSSIPNSPDEVMALPTQQLYHP